MSASRDRVLAVAEPVVIAAGYDVDDLSVMAAGRRRLVRVMIDSDSGVDLDEAAAVSRAISEALDEAGAMGETPYVLEVTSRGVDRPLTLPRHWRRAATRLVKVTLAHQGEADSDPGAVETLTGRIASSDDESVTLEIDDALVVISFAAIDKAIVQVEFNRRAPVGTDDIDDIDPLDDDDVDDDVDDDESTEVSHDDGTGRV